MAHLSYFPPNIVVPKVTRSYTSTHFTLYQPFAHTDLFFKFKKQFAKSYLLCLLILYHTGTQFLSQLFQLPPLQLLIKVILCMKREHEKEQQACVLPIIVVNCVNNWY